MFISLKPSRVASAEQLSPNRVRRPVLARLRLSFREREEISREIAAGVLLRSIARRLGRSASTVSREVAGNDDRAAHREAVAHRTSRRGARRPKPPKLACNLHLSQVVEDKLALWWSPLQISRWLMDAYPGDEEMRVSHETIYQSLFIQGKGSLRKELWRCLRTRGSQGESGVDLTNCSSWSGR